MKNIIIWDFDGVIADSMQSRSDAFRYALEGYRSDIINDLLSHHVDNGGKSRYEKFGRIIDKYSGEVFEIDNLLLRYSEYIKKTLFTKNILNVSVANTIQINHTLGIVQYIASGSDQKELQSLVKFLDIDVYFSGIYGSPIPKKKLVQNIILLEKVHLSNFLLIGDSINDMEAADSNGIKFLKYTLTEGLSNERIFS